MGQISSDVPIVWRGGQDFEDGEDDDVAGMGQVSFWGPQGWKGGQIGPGGEDDGGQDGPGLLLRFPEFGK